MPWVRRACRREFESKIRDEIRSEVFYFFLLTALLKTQSPKPLYTRSAVRFREFLTLSTLLLLVCDKQSKLIPLASFIRECGSKLRLFEMGVVYFSRTCLSKLQTHRAELLA
jgi:hypothetical protein